MKTWCPLSVSNRRPSAYKADALPAELKGPNEFGQNIPGSVLGRERSRQCSGWDEGNRTLAGRLKADCSTFELHPPLILRFTFSDRRTALLGLRCAPALRFKANATKGFRAAGRFGFDFITTPG